MNDTDPDAIKATRRFVKKANRRLAGTDFVVVSKRRLEDMRLHEYESYEQYREIQIKHNLRKIDHVWADAGTLDKVAALARSVAPSGPVRGLCHGTRNGFEQSYLTENHPDFDVLGTDISPSATDFPRSVVWDFHDPRDDWAGSFDFVYSNALDQSWKPQEALRTWFSQVREGGLVILEHTDNHGPMGAGEMDPFGIRAEIVPYVLAEWFGHQVSFSITQGRKDNLEKDVRLFAIRKIVPDLI